MGMGAPSSYGSSSPGGAEANTFAFQKSERLVRPQPWEEESVGHQACDHVSVHLLSARHLHSCLPYGHQFLTAIRRLPELHVDLPYTFAVAMLFTTTTAAVLVCFSLSAFVPLATAVSFDFTSFDRETTLTCSPMGKGICLQGDAFLNRGLQLTKNQLDDPITSSTGRAVYSEPVHIWDAATHRAADFTARFSFLINDVDPGNPSGDGLAFFLSSYPSLIPDDSSGGFLGLFPNSSLACVVDRSEVVAVEFDTYWNRDWDSSPGDHIGIDVNSIQSVKEVTLEGGIKKKGVTNVCVSYNASSHALGVSLYYDEAPVSYQGIFKLSQVVDLREVLPEYVAIGFSAATGLWVETHSILSWSFHSTLEMEKAGYIPSLVIVFLMAAALLGAMVLAQLLVWSRRAVAADKKWMKVEEREDREGTQSQVRDLYPPFLCMEEHKGGKEGIFTVDAEPMGETAGNRGGEFNVDADANAIDQELTQEDSKLHTTKMAEEVGDDENCRLEAVQEEEGGDGGSDTSSGILHVTEPGRDERTEMLNASDDVEAVENNGEDGNDGTFSRDANHRLDNVCRSNELAGVSEERGDDAQGVHIVAAEVILLNAAHMMDLNGELAQSVGHSERSVDISSDAQHTEEGAEGSGNIAENAIEDAKLAMETAQSEEQVVDNSLGAVHPEQGRRAEDILNVNGGLVMERGADEHEDIRSSAVGNREIAGGEILEEDVTGNLETTEEQEGEQDTREVLAAMNFLEKRSPEEIPYEALVAATDNFSEERMLGRGGFGVVYKGFLRDWGIYVAIKKLSDKSMQGIKEYVSEVKIISQLRHRNLVKLIGWCHEQGRFLLVYEFMSNGSLDYHLFESGTQLSWPVRYNIIFGLANALLYLHEECEQYVVHRDVKASNVLLDETFDAKLGDFGLARLFNHDITSLEVTQLAGTRGYMAPEYALMGKASKGSDVYSFGVVVLEIACGLRSVQVTRTSAEGEGSTAMLLVESVWERYGNGSILEAADRRLGGEFDPQLMERLLQVGLWCAHPDLNQRPTISQARLALLFSKTVPLPVLPPKMPPWSYPLEPGAMEMQPQMDNGSSTSQSSSKKPSRSLFSRFVWWWRRKARNPRKITDEEIKMETDEIRMGTGMREFSYNELQRATGGFAADKKMGESNYCAMYRATLAPGGDAAVKWFLQPHGQGKQWYIGEMMTLSHLAHKNLVKLIGWCHEGDKFLLVVEYTANGNLGHHLFGRRGSRMIPWDVRYKVAIGVASALCFLHDWGLCVLHRDVKSENVMLDEEFNAKLGGFELSRVVDHDDSSLVTTRVAGTMGYMAPEYAISGTYTKESDVYSFGAVALEIACGRMIIDRHLPRDKEHLLRWVQKCNQKGRLLDAVDQKLEGNFNQQEVERLMAVGLWCSSYDPSCRPPMAKVLRALQFKEGPPRTLPG